MTRAKRKLGPVRAPGMQRQGGGDSRLSGAETENCTADRGWVAGENTKNSRQGDSKYQVSMCVLD